MVRQGQSKPPALLLSDDSMNALSNLKDALQARVDDGFKKLADPKLSAADKQSLQAEITRDQATIRRLSSMDPSSRVNKDLDAAVR